jgi:hypothetical protein
VSPSPSGRGDADRDGHGQEFLAAGHAEGRAGDVQADALGDALGRGQRVSGMITTNSSPP